MEEVQRMLKRNHGEHYKVYNLCSEKTYEPSSFEGRVERFPFDGLFLIIILMFIFK